MKYISPGPVCISVENTIRSRVGDTVQVERSFLEIDVDMMGGHSRLLASHTKILLCHHRRDKQSSGGEWSAEVQRSIAERGGVREGESRIAGLCGFVKGFKVRSSTRSLAEIPVRYI